MLISSPVKKIKIIIVTPNLFCGGAAKVISLLCNNINKQQFDIILACINSKNAFYAIDKNVKVVDLNKVHVRNSISKLYTLIKKEKPDIVFSNGEHLNIFIAFLKIFFGKRIYFIARETSILSTNNTQLRFPAFFNFLVKSFYPKFTKLVCQSKAMADDFINYYKIAPDKIEIIYNPTNPIIIDNHKNLFNTNKLRLLSIARLAPEKGYSRLLDVIKKLSVPFEYIILGDGNERDKLEKKAVALGLNDCVHFKGAVNNPGDYISECDIFIHGAYQEGFPNVIIEVGMYGKPVIAFKEPGIGSEVIRNDFNGFLITPDDTDAYVTAIENLSKNKPDSNAIIDFTIARHSLDNVIIQYETLFSNAVTQKTFI